MHWKKQLTKLRKKLSSGKYRGRFISRSLAEKQICPSFRHNKHAQYQFVRKAPQPHDARNQNSQPEMPDIRKARHRWPQQMVAVSASPVIPANHQPCRQL